MNGVLEIYSKLKEGEPMKKGVATIRKVNVTEDKAYYSNIRYIIDDKKFMCIRSGQYIILDIKGKGIMMSDTPMEKRTNKDFVKKANGRVFIAGLGIGLIIHNLKSKIQSGEVSEIVVFELEQDVIGTQVYLVPTLKTKIMNWIKRLFKKRKIVEPQKQALNIPAVSGRSEQFSCPLPDARCDRHRIDDEEGNWEFCNTCKREWAR